MVNTKNVSIKNPGQPGVPGLLYVSIAAAFLTICNPVFADANTAQIQSMQKKINEMQDQLNQVTTAVASQSSTDTGLPIHGFMDVGYALNSQGKAPVNPNVPNPSGFYEGRLSFYLTPHFGDNVKALAEPNFEVSQQDGTVNVDIERLQIGYTFSDSATLWGGRFHTPYGYWNTAFHHGAQLQTSVLRPRFLDFEDSGGILPSHMLGVWGTGKIRMDEDKFTYDWFVGNGPKIVDATANPITPPASYQGGGLDPNIAGDDNHSAMVGLNLGYEFSGEYLDGLRLALHWLQGNVNAYGSTANGSTPTVNSQPSTLLNTTNLNVGGGSLVYLSNDWEIMGEYYGFNNKDMSSDVKYKSRAGYLQVGTNFGDFTPYLRLERTLFDQADNYFSMQANGQSYARQALGLRYNLNPKAALKLELMNSSFKEETGRAALDYRSLNLQYAIGF
jgi:hypothetical protein